MALRDLQIDDEYRSDECPDIGYMFVSKMLEQTVVYKRAVGFFSSSALISISRGLSYLIKKNNCHIYFVVSPHLYKEDVEAIKLGYKNRQTVIEEALLRDFTDTKDRFEQERLNFLCHLIEEGILDIKIADKYDFNASEEYGMFHEKIGVFEDEYGDRVAFTGSLNESENAFAHNFESIQVYTSWDEPKRVARIEDNFDRLWDDKTKTLHVYEFPEAVKRKLFSYRKNDYHRNIDEYERTEKIREEEKQKVPYYGFPYDLHDYQKKAINKWANNGFKGIFDMGTGTGKTITAYTASVKLLERLKYKLATIVVCPYTHLVEQWVEDQKYFNINFIVGYSDGKYKNYLSQLAKAIQDYNDGIISYFYFITTNASYKTEKVQKLLSTIEGNVLFIADEVHNFGADGLQLVMNENFKYRLGLSATVDRHRDEEGTNAIYSYFGDKCITYGLKEAIANDVLTRYYYYTIPVYLDDEEQSRYIELTEKIRKNTYPTKNGGIKLTKQGEFYALQRARIIATAKNKLLVLKELMKKYKDEHNILVYCGTGKIKTDTGDEEKQIDEVCKVLGNELQMKICRYTSRETTSERHDIAERYKSGDLQALVAIKCLDEGVNIPSIKTAFILASSTNPREYIQRRGRVLRKFEGKKYSYIFDFVTLPVALSEVKDYVPAFVESFRALAKNEVERIKEFSSLAENEHESDEFINQIIEAFDLNRFNVVEEIEEIEWSDYDD